MKKKLAVLSIITLCSAVLFTWCKKTEEIKSIQEWDTVTISYDSYLLDWEIIEENIIQTITIWNNDSFSIFDTELIWLKSWDTKNFTTNDPKEWYGIAYDNLKVQKLNNEVSNAIADSIWKELKVWEQINLWHLNWIITEITPVNMTIDFNDRQTRENVEFHVTVLDIENDTAKN